MKVFSELRQQQEEVRELLPCCHCRVACHQNQQSVRIEQVSSDKEHVHPASSQQELSHCLQQPDLTATLQVLHLLF